MPWIHEEATSINQAYIKDRVVKKYYKHNKINNSTTFCEYLLEKYNIACTPGSAFGNDDYLRICYSIDDNQLQNVIIPLPANKKDMDLIGNLVRKANEYRHNAYLEEESVKEVDGFFLTWECHPCS